MKIDKRFGKRLLNNLTIAACIAFSTVTTNVEAKNVRIAVLSDVHVTPGNAADSLLRLAVKEINAQPFDIVIVNGDLSNEGSDAELKNIKGIFDEIVHPHFVLPGNHENNWSQSAVKTFFDLWGNDRFVTELDSLVLIGINCGPYLKMGDGHIKQEDLHWLESTLKEKTANGKKVLNFNHYPIQDDLDNWNNYLAVLEKYPVIGHVNGHYHHWKHYRAGDLDAVMTRALQMKGEDAGYAIIEIDPTWIHVYNKQINKSSEAKYAWPVKTTIKPHKRDEVKEIVNPEGMTVTKVWADSASVFTRLAFDNDNVYFGTSLGQARAVGKNDKTLKWSVPTGTSLYSRPVVLAKGNVAFPASTSIEIIDPATGKVTKSITSKEGPYVADGTVIGNRWYQGGYKRFEARDSKTGKLIWEYDSLFNYCQAAPAITDKEIIFGAWDTNLRSLDLKTGKLRWVWNNGKKANMLGPGNVVPVITENVVYTVAPDRFMTAIDRNTGKQLWRNNSHKFRESLGHSEDNKLIYAKTMDGELVAVDATAPEYKEAWVVDMGIGYDHAPCIVLEKDGVVYAGSRRGILTLVDPVKAEVIASLPLGTSEINGIDVDPATGDVYVSLIEGTIYKISKN